MVARPGLRGGLGEGVPGRKSLEGEGGLPPLPPPHCTDSTPKAFPYPNTSPDRISNRQKPPPPTAFTSPVAALQPLWGCPDGPPPLQAKPWSRVAQIVTEQQRPCAAARRRGVAPAWHPREPIPRPKAQKKPDLRGRHSSETWGCCSAGAGCVGGQGDGGLMIPVFPKRLFENLTFRTTFCQVRGGLGLSFGIRTGTRVPQPPHRPT